MKALAKLAATFALVTNGLACASESLGKDALMLSRCEIVYSYSGQLLQLQNNIGGALAIYRRTALITTAIFFLNQENGVIAGWKVRKMKELRVPIKSAFDTGSLDPLQEARACDKHAMPFASAIRAKRQMLWGKSFDEIQDLTFQKIKSSAGLG